MLSSHSKKAKLALLVAAVGVSLWGIAFWGWLITSVPEDSDWQRAGKFVKEHWQKKDFAAITPYWAFQGEAALRGKRKMLTQHPEAELYPDTKRLWVLSAFGRFDSGRKQLANKNGVKHILHKTFGNVEVDLFEFAETYQVKFDFVEHIDYAEVFMLKERVHKTSCGPMIGNRFICSPNDWNWVGTTYKFIGLAKRKVIWAHPVKDSLNIQFYDIVFGKKLVVNTALTLFGATLPEGTPVVVDIYIDGKLFATATQPNSAKMHHFEFDLGKYANGMHDIRFSIHSKNIGRRHFVFQSYTY